MLYAFQWIIINSQVWIINFEAEFQPIEPLSMIIKIWWKTQIDMILL